MRARTFLCGLALALGAAPVSAELPAPSRAAINSYVASESDNAVAATSPALDHWRHDLAALLKSEPTDRAAARLAARYGMSRSAMTELVRLWLFVQARLFQRPTEAQNDALRQAFRQLANQTGGSELVLQAAVESLDGLELCNREDVDALAGSAADPVRASWYFATHSSCAAWRTRFLAAASDRAAALLFHIRGEGRLADRLVVSSWFLDEEGMGHVQASDRAALRPRLEREYLDLLLDAGLRDRAIDFVESLDSGKRDEILKGGFAAATVEIDGLPEAIDAVQESGTTAAGLAGAYLLEGRSADAERLLAAIDAGGKASRAAACLRGGSDRPSSACAGRQTSLEEVNAAGYLLLDQLLHRSGEDPYAVVEALYGSSGERISGGIGADLSCALMEADYPSLCAEDRGFALAKLDAPDVGNTDPALYPEVVAAMHGGRLAAFRSEFDAAVARRKSALAAAGAQPEPTYARESIEPAPPPFALHPLPDSLQGKADATAASLRGLARLPEGYAPVRAERQGDRVIVVSLSQNFDPTGEVSGGGYWIHLSKDGGKSWDPPLYTGLAEMFPYVVVERSPMPMLHADHVALAVEIRELDTASITYPPVALRTRRRESSLYLDIPLAELARDSDGDGLTDIAAHHLLLDVPPTEGTPFLVAPTGDCSGPVDAERQVMAALLRRIFSGGTGAIVEPVDRPSAPVLAFGGWRAAGNSVDRPIFVTGDPKDYACLRPFRLMIVYGAKDIARLRRQTPDFHAVEIRKIIINRARNRGFVRWSAGWTGGTTRFRLVDGKWQLDDISSWIT